MAAATRDLNYWKDPYEIEAEANLAFDGECSPSPLSSSMSPTPRPTLQLVPPPARRTVRNGGSNNPDNSLEFGPGHPTTFSARTRGARGVRRAPRG